jgi:hypothetical protein
MDKQLEARLYDRLADLTRDDGGRLMEHLETAASTAQRQTRHEQKRRAEGFQRVPIWVHESELAALRQRYPGPRGGVEWGAVIQAALGDAPADLAQAERERSIRALASGGRSHATIAALLQLPLAEVERVLTQAPAE